MAFVIYQDIADKIRQGQRLVTLEDFVDPYQAQHVEDGDRIHLHDDAGEFVAQALVGRQNKGFAWVFSDDRTERWSPEFIEDTLSMAFAKRQGLFNQDTTAYRLFNGEGDGIGGVTMDQYGDYLQINWYSKGIFAYRHWFMEAIQALDTPFMGIYETKRFMTEDGQAAIEHTWGKVAPQPLIIAENGIQYAIYLGEEWMTGLFLDQRDVRQFVQSQALHLSVLNLFSYTGGFSVATAVGGADKTVSVDVANRSLARTQEQFALNGIPAPSQDHEIRVMDVFDYIQYAKRHGLSFDVIVCDPPSFARTKKIIFSAEKDYRQLADQLFDLLAPGGYIVLSTNHAGYLKEDFLSDMVAIAQKHGGQLIQSFDMPQDFPTSADAVSQYLKVLVFYR